MYFASAPDRAVFACLLLANDIRFSLINSQYPLMDFLSILPLASQNPTSLKYRDLFIKKSQISCFFQIPKDSLNNS